MINIKELKEKIDNKSYIKLPLIFKYKSNDFLCFQYINVIASINNKEIKYLGNLENAVQEGFNSNINNNITSESNYIFVIKEDKIKDISKYNIPDVCILICKQCEGDAQNINIIDFPDLLDWQVKDFIKTSLPGINDDNINYLYKVTQGDIYRINQECLKLKNFPMPNQNEVFNQLKEQHNFSDLNNINIFNLINAIIGKNISEVSKILKEINILEINTFGLITLILNSFTSVLKIQSNPQISAQNLGIEYRQYRALSYYCNKYTTASIIDIIKFLTNIDYRIKSGNLNMNSSDFLNYIIYNVLERGNY